MRHPKVYVAGASDEPERVAWAMASIRMMGCEVVYDWLAAVDEIGAKNEDLTYDERRDAAIECMKGVLTADVLWVLAPEVFSAGSWWEMGYAMRAGTQVMVSGPSSERCIFGVLCLEAETDTEALSIMRNLFNRSEFVELNREPM